MKRYKIVVLLVSVLIFTGCGDILEGDKGPAGPTGIDGSSGTDGSDGSDGTDGSNVIPAGRVYHGVNINGGECNLQIQYDNYNMASQDVELRIVGDGNNILNEAQTIGVNASYLWSVIYQCDAYANMSYTITVDGSYTFAEDI